MSSTLGQGFVALTPINLDTLPGSLEGSKAGLLDLWWSSVMAANHSYTQPVSLLLQYQQGQFTTVQAVLIDNSQVAYPVLVVSSSTGQRIIAPAYSQVMAPLLVSVAPQFEISLMIPTGASNVVDQVSTLFFFLNTPQYPYSVTGLHSAITQTQLATGSVSINSALNAPPGGWASGDNYTAAMLVPAFPPGGTYETYVSISLSVIQTQLFEWEGTSYPFTLTVLTSHGGAMTWQVSGSIPSGQITGPILTVDYTYPPNVNDTTGDPILLQYNMSVTGSGGVIGITGGFTINYSFYYTFVQP